MSENTNSNALLKNGLGLPKKVGIIYSDVKREYFPTEAQYITEKEADRMLMPYLIRLVKRIESGEEETISWEEVRNQLKKSS